MSKDREVFLYVCVRVKRENLPVTEVGINGETNPSSGVETLVAEIQKQGMSKPGETRRQTDRYDSLSIFALFSKCDPSTHWKLTIRCA